MPKLSYSEQLRHPNWQRRRLQVLEGAGWRCTCCGDDGSMLHVHHRRYVKGRMAWEYEDHELTALCVMCHEQAHEAKEAILCALMQAGELVFPKVSELINGYLDAEIVRKDIGPEVSHTYVAGVIAWTLEDYSPEDIREIIRMRLNNAPDSGWWRKGGKVED